MHKSSAQVQSVRPANLFLLFISLALTLVAAEFILRSYLKIPSDFLAEIVRFDPSLVPHKRLRPNLNVHLTGAYREFRFHLTTDAQGFRRTAPYDLNLGPRHDIVILGDSQSFGVGVNDDQTFASELSRRLRVSLLNASCPGENTIEEYLLARELLTKESPQYLFLFFFSGNDPYENYTNRALLWNESAAVSSETKMRHTAFSKAVLKDFLIRKSAIYNAAVRLRRLSWFNRFFLKLGLANAEFPSELIIFKRAEDPRKNAYWQITEQALVKLRDLAREHNVKLVVSLLPDRYQVETEYWQMWLAKYRLNPRDFDLFAPNRALESFCQKNEIEFLDLTPALRSHQSRGERMYWKIDNHLGRAGNRVVAEATANYLQQHQDEKNR